MTDRPFTAGFIFTNLQPDAHSARMDHMYRFQRRFYDVTRKYYLFGRDALLHSLVQRGDEKVLEVGCGTGRNLHILQRRFPQLCLYGLDASSLMLDVAKRRNMPSVRLQRGLAEELHTKNMFDIESPAFDAVFFSYSLSMIPDWRNALDRSSAALRPGGSLHVVDFFDMRGLPRIVRERFRKFLKSFGVEYTDEMLSYFYSLAAREHFDLTLRILPMRYAMQLQLKKVR